MLTMMSTDITQRRRQFYKRAMTLSSIPPQLIPEVDNENDEDEQTRLLRSPRHMKSLGTTDRGGSGMTSEGNSPSHGLGQTADNPEESSAKTKRTLFQQRRSITISTDEPLLPLKDINSGRRSPFSKSPTSPSAILAKFKERIQQSLFLTSTEWPSAAAILQDRRQKANEHAKAAIQQKDLDIHMTELTKKRKRCRRSDTIGHAADESILDNDGKFGRCRMKSDPVVHLSETAGTSSIEDDTLPPEIELKNINAARDAFRRRSISEDTYDRLPTTFIKERKQTIASVEAGTEGLDSELNSSKSSNSGGVICSNEDLQNILTCYKKEMTPTPVVAPSRTISVDVSKYPRQSYCSQSSYASQTSHGNRTSYTSQTSVLSNKSLKSDTSETINCDSRHASRLGSTNSSVHVYPEVILDSARGKAMIGSVDDDILDGDIDDLGCIEGAGTDNIDQQEQQQPPEIIFDELGQTWDVYGAEFDPEILGGAIQKHLERLMSKNNEKVKLYSSSGPSNSDSSMHETHITESNQQSFVDWWRFLCLFGTNKKQTEPTMC